MRYDAILFDLDGTLCDSAPGLVEALRYALASVNYPPVDDAVLKTYIGPPLHHTYRDVLGMDEETVARATAVFREYYRDVAVSNARIYTGIPNLLRALKEEGAYLAVATAKTAPMARRVLEDYGILKYFDRVVASTAERTTPDKADLIHEALPAQFQRAAVVGDREYDIQAAKDNRVDSVGVKWGYAREGELEEAGADYVAESVKELGEILCGHPVLPPRGFFISIEGLDGSGKTTQMNALTEYLLSRGYEVVTTREPGGTPTAEDIRALILNPEKTMDPMTEALLYAAARAEHVRGIIRPALDRGKVVLCDRFVDSSIAYQGGGRELGIELVLAINAPAMDGTLPDLTLLYTVDAQTAFLRRSGATKLDRVERSGEAFFHRVYDAYAALAAANPGRIHTIDGCETIENVKKASCREIDQLLARR